MPSHRALLMLLLLCLGLRGFTLEYPDLVDPTESRYAYVAQEMYLTGDWVVPRLPWKGETEAYLGKPPLHFWLTAVAFSLFSMDEWAVRLPSYLALIVMCIALAGLRRIPELKDSYMTAIFIMISTGLMFFMSGASIVDVTLSACTTAAFSSLLLLYREKIPRYYGGAIFAVALACGFLTKGPIALVLLILPVCICILVSRSFSILRKVPWFLVAILFLCFTAPWFLAAEQSNPGFLRYFFVNENFKRYLFKEYGDRYGTGHRYPYGTAWGMLLLGFMPWTAVFIDVALRKWRSMVVDVREPVAFYCLCWALSPVVFFTLVHQLHFAYVLPGVPGLAIILAFFLKRYTTPSREILYRALGSIVAVGGLGCFGYGLFQGLSWWLIYISLPLLGIALVSLFALYRKTVEGMLAVVTVASFCVVTTALAQVIGDNRSTESILRCITHLSSYEKPKVGIVDDNSYSTYFYSRAWHYELEKPVEIIFLSSKSIPKVLPKDIIIRSREWEELRSVIPENYAPFMSFDRWVWLRDRGDNKDLVRCPRDL